jgi:hypothetical protein
VNVEQIATLLVLGAGAIGAITYIAKGIRKIVHTVDRLEDLAKPTHDVAVYELTNNGGGSLKDKVEAALASSRAALDSSQTTRGLVQLVADELAGHGRQSRAAMAIYRQALADQGIHLPVAPGEGGYLELEEN